MSTLSVNTIQPYSGSTVTITGFTVTGSAVTGSVASASYAATASYATNFNIQGTAKITGSLVGNVGGLTIASNTASMDLSTGNFFTLTLPAGDTRINPTNIATGQTINLIVTTASGSGVTFPSSVKQVSGSSYVPTQGTSTDVLTFISPNTSSLLLSNVKNLV